MLGRPLRIYSGMVLRVCVLAVRQPVPACEVRVGKKRGNSCRQAPVHSVIFQQAVVLTPGMVSHSSNRWGPCLQESTVWWGDQHTHKTDISREEGFPDLALEGSHASIPAVWTSREPSPTAS